jgi:Fe-S-cluster containining protein
MEKSSREGHVFFEQHIKPKDFSLSEQLCEKLTNHVHDKNNYSKMTKVRIIYDLLDEIMNETPNVCRVGCAHCCRIPVEIMPIEAEYIAYNTDLKPGNHKEKPRYCPLLDQQTATCTVYKYRPFNCRAFAVFNSPDYCRDDKPQFSTGGPGNNFSSPGILYLCHQLIELDIRMPVHPDHKELLDKRIRDIRSYF